MGLDKISPTERFADRETRMGWIVRDVVRNPGMISDETICGV
jgi:hypothetical protein